MTSAAPVAVGIIEGLASAEVELTGPFVDASGNRLVPGRHVLTSESAFTPVEPTASSFALPSVPIGIGFHWERKERQVFRGALRVLRRAAGLTVVNDIPLEEYVTSVISSEMSASCPPELLKAHAVISRSWLRSPGVSPARRNAARGTSGPGEIRRWYGREAHADFDVCADDHCQRYQGITKVLSPAVAGAVRATAGEMLHFEGTICDARFSKACGGITETYSTCWEDLDTPYLSSVRDADEGALPAPVDAEGWIRSSPASWCDTRDAALLSRILPGFDQETTEFYRWRVAYTPGELGGLIRTKLKRDLGAILDLAPLARGPSTRISRLRITGERGELVVGKELEIRRALSPSHLYSSAFVVDREGGRLVLRGAGWGHGVGLCQVGAAVMAAKGRSYREILSHYYRGVAVGVV